MKAPIQFALCCTAAVVALLAQGPTSDTLPTGQLLSEPGPTFQILDNQLATPLTLVSYGDQRFTDPANTRQTDPRIRRWLVNQIGVEHPAAVLMNGDVPLAGDVPN